MHGHVCVMIKNEKDSHDLFIENARTFDLIFQKEKEEEEKKNWRVKFKAEQENRILIISFQSGSVHHNYYVRFKRSIVISLK